MPAGTTQAVEGRFWAVLGVAATPTENRTADGARNGKPWQTVALSTAAGRCRRLDLVDPERRTAPACLPAAAGTPAEHFHARVTAA